MIKKLTGSFALLSSAAVLTLSFSSPVQALCDPGFPPVTVEGFFSGSCTLDSFDRTATGAANPFLTSPFKDWSVQFLSLISFPSRSFLTFGQENLTEVMPLPFGSEPPLLSFQVEGQNGIKTGRFLSSLNFVEPFEQVNATLVSSIYSDPGFTNLLGLSTVTIANGDPIVTEAVFPDLTTIYVTQIFDIQSGSLFSVRNNFSGVVPEPLTLLGASAAVGWGVFFKRRRS